MNKLTASRCRVRINELRFTDNNHGLSNQAYDYLEALEVALPVLEQQESPTDTYRQIENDGWIELGEGAIPVHPETLVEIKMRNGATDGPRKATGFLWYRGNALRDEMGCDIIAYRVIENDGREG